MANEKILLFYMHELAALDKFIMFYYLLMQYKFLLF